MFAFALTDDRGHEDKACAVRPRHDRVRHLVDGLPLDDAPATRAVRNADAGEQKSQVVVDFCHGSHRGARVSTRCFLVNGNGG